MTELRIGITMRQIEAPDYDETRDALARDWARLMHAALPQALWMPLPNLGAASVDMARQWRLNGLILSGGNDLGAALARDESESALVSDFRSRQAPILGVCRGLQLLWTLAGGELGSTKDHAGSRHRVAPITPNPWLNRPRTVNSYHTQALTGPEPAEARMIARTDDGAAEAVEFDQGRTLGIMWHPEREPEPEPQDLTMLQQLFGH